MTYSTKLHSGLKTIALAGAMALSGYACTEKDTTPTIKGGPLGYEIMDFQIPTRGNVKTIYLDSTKTNITRNPEEGTITYKGPLKYEISNPRSPAPQDAGITRQMATDTRNGEITLRKSTIDDKF